MKDHINGYSLALFSLAKEEKKLMKYKAEATLVVDALNQADEYEDFLSSNSIDVKTKEKMIKQAFGKMLNKNLLNFLYVLVDRNKFRIAIPILNKLVKLINEDANINEGVVYTTSKLAPNKIKEIELRTEKLLNTKVTLKNKIDLELISGLRIQVGDDVIEDSVLSRLDDVRSQLLGKDNNAS